MLAIKTVAPSTAMELTKKATMSSEQPDPELSETAQQINDLFDSAELSKAIETEEFKQFLDYIPIAIVVSKFFRGDQRICYANKAFETLVGQDTKDCAGGGWSILAGFKDENDSNVTLESAIANGQRLAPISRL
ncbi:PAS domain-containing protein [Bradyrhizobium sp. TZ2]